MTTAQGQFMETGSAETTQGEVLVPKLEAPQSRVLEGLQEVRAALVEEGGFWPQIDRIDAAIARLSAEPAQPNPCWLIERGQKENHAPTVWLTNEGRWWSEDANKARRYPTKELAEASAAELLFGDPSYSITEHSFGLPGAEPKGDVPCFTSEQASRMVIETGDKHSDRVCLLLDVYALGCRHTRAVVVAAAPDAADVVEDAMESLSCIAAYLHDLPAAAKHIRRIDAALRAAGERKS